jgi:nicotinamide mononucleotide transporter
MTEWNAALSYLASHLLEVSGFTTTLIGIWLMTRRSMFCWPFIMVANLLYLTILSRAQLYSGALLQFFYIAFSIYGWWHWRRGVQESGEVRIVPITRRALLVGLAVGTVGALLLGWLMSRASASLAQLDAALASFSLLATWWQSRKHIANWALWIAVDLIYIGEYIYKGLMLTALLYALLVLLALLGLRDWSKAPHMAE